MPKVSHSDLTRFYFRSTRESRPWPITPQALLAVSLGLILFSLIVIARFIIFVHTMPGKIACKRGNPQAEAIEILSLLGLLIFPLWMAALVWSYMRPFTVPVALVSDSPKDAAAPEPPPEPEAVLVARAVITVIIGVEVYDMACAYPRPFEPLTRQLRS